MEVSETQVPMEPFEYTDSRSESDSDSRSGLIASFSSADSSEELIVTTIQIREW